MKWVERSHSRRTREWEGGRAGKGRGRGEAKDKKSNSFILFPRILFLLLMIIITFYHYYLLLLLLLLFYIYTNLFDLIIHLSFLQLLRCICKTWLQLEMFTPNCPPHKTRVEFISLMGRRIFGWTDETFEWERFYCIVAFRGTVLCPMTSWINMDISYIATLSGC